MTRTPSRQLMTVQEIVEASGAGLRTVRRWVTDPGVYAEYRHAKTARGNTVRVLYVDVLTLPAANRDGWLQLKPGNEAADLTPTDLGVQVAESTSLKAALRIVATVPKGEWKPLLEQISQRFDIGLRTLYRRLARLKTNSLDRQRSDAGDSRIPQRIYSTVVVGIVSNELSASTAAIHRALLRAVPDDMTYERGGAEQIVSVTTVGRIRKSLMEDPNTRLLFYDQDAREEFLRTWSGSIVAPHANSLWYADMTRCDTLVIDPETGATFRPRMHVTVDIYSGCVPGIVFSKEENQTQTDLLLLRSLLPKRGPWAHKYPIFGTPERLRTDNGSIYASLQTRRVTAGIGINMIFGMVGRPGGGGPVERFFGSAHNFEKTLVGYVGPNAVSKSSKELKRLERNAKEWLKHGRDPGPTNRLMTIGEYQEAMLTWLVVEYHQWEVGGGETRLQRFVDTAPESTLIQLDEQELLLHLAHRVTRTVDAAGRIRLNNRLWTVLDGSLAKYQGVRVQVLSDQFALDPDRHLVAWEERSGQLHIIGEAQPAPEIADSLEAQEHRRASHAVMLEEIRRQREMKRDLTNPHLRISNVLRKEFAVAAEPQLDVGPKARLAAVTPPALEEPAPDDELGRAIAAIQQPKFGPDTDPLEILRFHNRRGGRGRDE